MYLVLLYIAFLQLLFLIGELFLSLDMSSLIEFTFYSHLNLMFAPRTKTKKLLTMKKTLLFVSFLCYFF